MANHGLPKPELQVEIRDASGRLIARVDSLLNGACIVEFDGAMKYGDAKDLVAEKWREDRLRALGFEVVRVGWPDLDHPYTTATRIGEAVVRAHRRRAPVGAGPALRGP